MIFSNGRLILPDGVREGWDLIITGGRISQIAPTGSVRGEQIDLNGNYLAPGFIDLHVHGAVGRDTMEGSREAFRQICDYHASGGTTSLLLTTVTAPIPDIVAVLAAVRAMRAELPMVPGVHLEGPFLSRERAGAQRAEWILEPNPEAIESIMAYRDVVQRITVAPELPGVLGLMDRLRGENISISGGHSDSWEEEARAGFRHGMINLTHTFNCMSTARRRGIYRVAGLLEVGLSEPAITCELIADGHHVSETLMKLAYQTKGASGICLVTDATAGAGLPPGTKFALGGVDCVVGDDVCVTADGSALAGSSARMIDLIRTMTTKVGVSLVEAVAMATETPARVMGFKDKGRLDQGCAADLVVLSAELEVLRTYVAGDVVFSR